MTLICSQLRRLLVKSSFMLKHLSMWCHSRQYFCFSQKIILLVSLNLISTCLWWGPTFLFVFVLLLVDVMLIVGTVAAVVTRVRLRSPLGSMTMTRCVHGWLGLDRLTSLPRLLTSNTATNGGSLWWCEAWQLVISNVAWHGTNRYLLQQSVIWAGTDWKLTVQEQIIFQTNIQEFDKNWQSTQHLIFSRIDCSDCSFASL